MKKQTETKGTSSLIKEQLKQVDEYFKEFNSEVLRQPKEKEHPVEIAFAISLKSKTVSRNWVGVQDNLAKTLKSIFGNTDQNFRILVAGHEKPDLEELQRKCVTWLSVDFAPPVDSGRFSSDKREKRRVIGAYLREKGYCGYFMPLDADDWIHYRFIEFIRLHPISDAYILNKGVMVNVSLKEAWLRSRFYRGCGSSAVFYFSKDDFPLSSKKEDVQGTPFAVVDQDHKKVAEHMEKIHRGHRMIDFPLVTWVLGHGDNNSVLKGKKDNGISADDYHAIGEELEDWFYDYFKIT